ncbi:MAG: hypothetical protein ACXW4Z_10085 [Candidatus Binatia bacterium]
MVNPLAVVAQEIRDLKLLSIEKSPLDSDIIAIPKRAETIHSAIGKAFCDLIVGVNAGRSKLNTLRFGPTGTESER